MISVRKNIRTGTAFLVTILLGCLFASTKIAAQNRSAGNLVVPVTGIRNSKGHILVSVWPTAQGFPSNPVRIIGPQAVAIDHAGLIAFATFRDLPAGDLSVTVMHDENDNGKMDKNLLGMPKEGFGVSNDPKKKLHLPTFDETKFHFDGSGQSISITMKLIERCSCFQMPYRVQGRTR